ncbi:MAG: hypothetical protein AAFY29_03145 [Pseudomonadota bacterium]
MRRDPREGRVAYIETTEEMRREAERMTREELIEEVIIQARENDAAEAVIEELRQTIATLDAVVSRHDAAREDYAALTVKH